MKKYYVHYLDSNYNNSNYQKKNKELIEESGYPPTFFNSCFIYIYISKFKKTFLVNKTLVVINGE
ncbi:hypothetical protein, partial [Mycoplasmopsis bovis]|uniref:hypothetical protein n=1 Tax=Mycoplasmopsis bovis TaxID=28903 RepID=UPI003D28FA95